MAKIERAVSREEIRLRVKKVLRQLAPDVEPDALDSAESLRRALAIDSMDILNFAVALYEALGVDIPEQDYGKLDTLDHCVDYLATAIAARAAMRPA